MGMDRENAARIVKGVSIQGDMADVHIREHGPLVNQPRGNVVCAGCPANVDVYVWPLTSEGPKYGATEGETLIKGYWFTPNEEEAKELVGRLAA